MTSKDIYLKRLKTMRETARTIKPAQKSSTEKVSLAPERLDAKNKEADCRS